MMQAGFLRLDKRHNISRKLNAICNESFGIELIFFTPEQVDTERGTIKGEVYKDGEWIEKEADIPKIINNTPYLSEYSDIRKYLDENSHLMFKPFGGKAKEYNYLKEEGTLKDYLIPSVRVNGIESIFIFLKQHHKIVIKPLYSDKGKGIYSIGEWFDSYRIIEGSKEYTLNESDFIDFYNDIIKGNNYLMTRYINSKTQNGHPFDIRLNFEKDERNKWTRAQNYVRIGINDKLTSNLDRGGGTIRTEKFLSVYHDKETSKYINNQISEITNKLPKVIEGMVDFDVNSIGADFGLNDDNRLYLFEVNSFPGSTNAVGQIALRRAGYTYNFLKNNVFSEESGIDEVK